MKSPRGFGESGRGKSDARLQPAALMVPDWCALGSIEGSLAFWAMLVIRSVTTTQASHQS